MSKTLLVVMSYAGGQSQVRWSFPFYQRSGFDILGTCPEDSPHSWPVGVKAARCIGTAGYASESLIRRWLMTVGTCLQGEYEAYDDFCVIEYDSVFFKAPPPHPGGLFTHLAGHKLNRGEQASHFYHCPWWFDRDAGQAIYRQGLNLIRAGQFELGSPDVFLGRIIEETGMPYTETGTFSVNGGALSYAMPHAIEAVKAGTWFAHGLRTEEELKQLLAVMP